MSSSGVTLRGILLFTFSSLNAQTADLTDTARGSNEPCHLALGAVFQLTTD